MQRQGAYTRLMMRNERSNRNSRNRVMEQAGDETNMSESHPHHNDMVGYSSFLKNHTVSTTNLLDSPDGRLTSLAIKHFLERHIRLTVPIAVLYRCSAARGDHV